MKKRPKKSTKKVLYELECSVSLSFSPTQLPRQYDAGKIVALVFSEIVCGISLESLTHANYRWFPPSEPDNNLKVRSIFFIFKKPLYLCGTFPVGIEIPLLSAPEHTNVTKAKIYLGRQELWVPAGWPKYNIRERMTNKKCPEPTDPFQRRQLPLSLGRMCAGSQSNHG